MKISMWEKTTYVHFYNKMLWIRTVAKYISCYFLLKCFWNCKIKANCLPRKRSVYIYHGNAAIRHVIFVPVIYASHWMNDFPNKVMNLPQRTLIMSVWYNWNINKVTLRAHCISCKNIDDDSIQRFRFHCNWSSP